MGRITDIIAAAVPALPAGRGLREKIAAHKDTFDPSGMMRCVNMLTRKLMDETLSALDIQKLSIALRNIAREVIRWDRWNLRVVAEEEIKRDAQWKRQVRQDLGGKPALVKWALMQRRVRNSSFSPFVGPTRMRGSGRSAATVDGGCGDSCLDMSELTSPTPHPLPSATRTPGTSPHPRRPHKWGEGEISDLPDYSEIFGPIKTAAEWVAEYDALEAHTQPNNTPTSPVTPVWPEAHLPSGEGYPEGPESIQDTRAPRPTTHKDTQPGGWAGSAGGSATRTSPSTHDSATSASKIKTDRDGLFRLAKIPRPGMAASRHAPTARTSARKPRALIGPWQPIELTPDDLAEAGHNFARGSNTPSNPAAERYNCAHNPTINCADFHKDSQKCDAPP